MIYAGAVLLVALTAGLTGLVAYIVWRAGFAQGWRRARSRPPTCPKCGYNMSGLRHCRCPECGVEYTLDQLWRAPIHGTTTKAADADPIGSHEESSAQ